ncbi:MAG: Na+/H+ antiporter NhaC family protein [Rikenellaceae bacterium]
MNRPELTPKPSPMALLPLVIFFALYLVVSIVEGDFYKMPIPVAFVVASVVAIAMCKGRDFAQRVREFSHGASDPNIMLMVWIFILAGAFAASTKAMGAVDATVNLTMELLPSRMLLVGIFTAACFISFAVGTSVGTVVALVPIAVGIAPKIGVDVAYLTSIIVGGAFFGDNLSFISDTTIAATQSQGCTMKDKFKANILLVLPAAILVAALYIFQGAEIVYPSSVEQVEWIKVIPYLAVIVLAIAGLNVMIVLIVGILLSGVIGLMSGGFDVWGYTQSLGDGIGGMGELIIITMLAGGLLELIRLNGGLEWLIGALTRNVRNKRMAELSIASLVSMANLCTANNTVAIITTGKISKDISQRFGVDPRRSASILDTFSCFVQGLLPYGAQLLMASTLAGLYPIDIIKTLYYPMLIGLFGLLAIIFRFPRKYA